MKRSPRVNQDRIVYGIILILAAYLSNYRSLIFWGLHSRLEAFPDQTSIEIVLWTMEALLVVSLLMWHGQMSTYWRNVRQQPWLLVFLLICVLSPLWASNPTMSIVRTGIMVVGTAVAAYIGMRSSTEELLRYLWWFGAAVMLTSIVTALTDPLRGLDHAYGAGVWRGMFWNKNHLGSLGALLGALFFLGLLGRRPGTVPDTRIWLALAYLGSLIMVYKSHSAAGYLLLLIMHVVVLLCWLWIAYGTRLQRHHYLLLAFVGAMLAVGILGNLEAIFRAFNKDITMTGRTSLWTYLIEEVVSRKPLLGYGFGSVWSDPLFRAQAFGRLGFRPAIGDNGFLDVILGVGALGFSAFLLFYFAAWLGAARFLVREKTLGSCWPVLLMAFSLFANISFSLLMEIELLVWGLIVIVLFATSNRTVSMRTAQ